LLNVERVPVVGDNAERGIVATGFNGKGFHREDTRIKIRDSRVKTLG
jgi:hypothetical protein